MPKATERNSELDQKYEPPCLPDGYPYGADSATKLAFRLAGAPKLTDEKKAALRALLMPGDR